MKKKVGKKEKILLEKMLQVVDDNHDVLKSELENATDGFLTIEWVGRKFGNTHGCDFDVGNVLHKDCKLVLSESDIPHLMENPISYWKECCERLLIEGIVFQYKNKYHKILASMLTPNCSFALARKQKGSVRTTHYTPRIFK